MSDSVYMEMAHSLAKLSKCVRLQVGCLLVKDGRVLSTGVNGTPSGYINCNEANYEDHTSGLCVTKSMLNSMPSSGLPAWERPSKEQPLTLPTALATNAPKTFWQQVSVALFMTSNTIVIHKKSCPDSVGKMVWLSNRCQ